MKCALGMATGSIILALAGAASGQVLDFYDINAYRTVDLNFTQANWYTLLQANYSTQTELAGSMTVDGVTYPNCGIRFRGNTSYTQLPSTSQKRSFNVRLDSIVPGQDIQGYSHLNFNNGFHDPTFLREFIAYYVMRQYGPAPGCNLIKLNVNGVYWGVYINVQQPNKDFTRQHWRSDEGNRYRGFPESGSFSNGRCALTWLGNLPSSYLSAYQANQGDGVDLMNLCNILNNTPTASIESALPVIFSVDQFYRYAATMNIMLQTDSYLQSGKDHYLYHDPVYGAFHMFPFDLNEALAGSSTLDPWYQTTVTTRPAFTKTLVIPAWRERYIAHYRNIAEDAMSWATLGPIITQFHTMIAADVAADTKKIYSTAAFTTNLTASVTVSNGGFGGTTTIPGLQPLITGRDAYLSAHADLIVPRPTLTNLQHSPANPTPAQSVTITVQASGTYSTVSLWSRSAGPFAKSPMFDDGMHGDGAAADGLFGAFLAPSLPGTLVDYYVESASFAGKLSFLPKTAEYRCPNYRVAWPQGPSPIVINEFLAVNNSVLADPAGEFEDYIELYNTSANPVDVSGMYLTDDLGSATKWQIPVGNIIPAFGTLLVWCDEDAAQAGLHANFKLSSAGEPVALFSSNGMTQHDGFNFGVQVANVSTGRLEDGGGPWVTFQTPTPNTVNEITCGSRRFSALTSTNHTISLVCSGLPQIGTTPSLDIVSGPAFASGLLFLAPAADYLPVVGTSLTALFQPAAALPIPIALSATGTAILPFTLPADPMIVGIKVIAQVAAPSSPTTWQASNAVEVVICP